MGDKYGAMPPPSCPPQFMEANQQEPPPPYSPYQPPTELDASNPYPPLDMQQDNKIGFYHQGGQPPVNQAPYVQQPAVSPQPVVVQVVQQIAVPLGPKSMRTTCPFCKADMSTSTVSEPATIAYIAAAVLFLIGCVCGCCLIPFCMDSCKVTRHHCANCKKFIGRHSP